MSWTFDCLLRLNVWKIGRCVFTSLGFIVKMIPDAIWTFVDFNFQCGWHMQWQSIRLKVSVFKHGWHIMFWGQTLKKCGLYLKEPVFSHGQLYVGMSRVARPENITVFMDKSCKLHAFKGPRKWTHNVVHEEVVYHDVFEFIFKQLKWDFWHMKTKKFKCWKI